MKNYLCNLVVIILICFTPGLIAQKVNVINHKGTLISLDSSKWNLSSGDIYNKNSGNVGIGLNNPSQKLDVSGNINFSGALMPAGNAGTIGQFLQSQGANTPPIWTTLSISTTHEFKDSAYQLVSRVNDVSAYIIPAAGTIDAGKTIGFDNTGKLVLGGASVNLFANNGLTKLVDSVQLGGSLTKPTTITTTSTNTLALQGLQSGGANDSILTIDPNTGVIKNKQLSGIIMRRVALSSLTKHTIVDAQTPANDIPIIATYEDINGRIITVNIVKRTPGVSFEVSSAHEAGSGYLNYCFPAQSLAVATTTPVNILANNGLTKTGDVITLGGSLIQPTTITTTSTNTLALQGLQSGGANDSILAIDPTTGVIKKIYIASISNKIGDVKQGFQTTDHEGWIKLDGRAKSSLTATQQTKATSLGFGANLPNATNVYLAQQNGTLGQINFGNTKFIARNQLPNFTLGGTALGASAGTPTGSVGIGNAGAHQHSIGTGWAGLGGWGYAYEDQGNRNASYNTDWAGDHSHSAWFTGNALPNHSHAISTDNINGGVSQQAFDVRPASMDVNTFIYLGL